MKKQSDGGERIKEERAGNMRGGPQRKQKPRQQPEQQGAMAAAFANLKR